MALAVERLALDQLLTRLKSINIVNDPVATQNIEFILHCVFSSLLHIHAVSRFTNKW